MSILYNFMIITATKPIKKLTWNMSVLIMVRPAGLEPARSPTRPSNVRVCLFRQGRISSALSQALINFIVKQCFCQHVFFGSPIFLLFSFQQLFAESLNYLIQLPAQFVGVPGIVHNKIRQPGLLLITHLAVNSSHNIFTG